MSSRGIVNNPSQMCAVIQILVRPSRQPRNSDFRGQSSISNRMTSPPITPRAKPGGLAPLGQIQEPDAGPVSDVPRRGCHRRRHGREEPRPMNGASSLGRRRASAPISREGNRYNSRPPRRPESERSPGGPDRDRAHMLYYKESHEPSGSWAFHPDAVSWRGPGRDRLTYRTDFPGSKMRIARWSPLLLVGLVIAALCRGQEPARPAANSGCRRSAAASQVSRCRLVFRDRLPRQHQEDRRADSERPAKRAHDLDVLRPALASVSGLVRRPVQGHRVQTRQTRRVLPRKLIRTGAAWCVTRRPGPPPDWRRPAG